MSIENQNNTSNWKDKLGELENLPGETLHDKNALWEKLYVNIKEKKSNKKVFWYWIAAACAIVIFFIAIINPGDKNDHAIKNEAVQIQPKNSDTATIQIAKKDVTEKIKPSLSVEKDESLTFENKKTKIPRLAISSGEKNLNHIADTVSEQIELTKSANVVSPLIDNNQLTITTSILSKKKLKVVHINELGDAVEESPDVARNADTRSFQFKIGNGEAYINPSAFSKTASVTLYKTKTSPN